MPPKKKPVNHEAFYALQDQWSQGGFVPPYIAANIFGVTQSHICKQWESMNLERVILESKPFITYSSIYKEFKRRESEESPSQPPV